MTFQVNPFTTIKNFERLNQFTTFQKFGEPFEYEAFKGEIKGKKVKGFICLADNNIYKLEKEEN